MPSDLITIPFPTRSSFWSTDSESMVRVKDSTMWLAMILFSAPESAAAKITSPQIINGKFTLFFEYYIKLEGSKTRSRKKSLADVLSLELLLRKKGGRALSLSSSSRSVALAPLRKLPFPWRSDPGIVLINTKVLKQRHRAPAHSSFFFYLFVHRSFKK